MNHTEACEAARAGHFLTEHDAWLGLVLTDRPDPYPSMRDLTEEGRVAVLSCGHRDHDVVRIFCQWCGEDHRPTPAGDYPLLGCPPEEGA